MSIIETLTVVDARRLNLPEAIWDYLADFYEIHNGSYHRYYPDSEWKYIKAEIKLIINQYLLAAGVTFPEVTYRPVSHPDGYYNYYLLLWFSW